MQNARSNSYTNAHSNDLVWNFPNRDLRRMWINGWRHFVFAISFLKDVVAIMHFVYCLFSQQYLSQNGNFRFLILHRTFYNCHVFFKYLIIHFRVKNFFYRIYGHSMGKLTGRVSYFVCKFSLKVTYLLSQQPHPVTVDCFPLKWYQNNDKTLDHEDYLKGKTLHTCMEQKFLPSRNRSNGTSISVGKLWALISLLKVCPPFLRNRFSKKEPYCYQDWALPFFNLKIALLKFSHHLSGTVVLRILITLENINHHLPIT